MTASRARVRPHWVGNQVQRSRPRPAHAFRDAQRQDRLEPERRSDGTPRPDAQHPTYAVYERVRWHPGYLKLARGSQFQILLAQLCPQLDGAVMRGLCSGDHGCTYPTLIEFTQRGDRGSAGAGNSLARQGRMVAGLARSEEHTSELQSRGHLVCRLLLEKKKMN